MSSGRISAPQWPCTITLPAPYNSNFEKRRARLECSGVWGTDRAAASLTPVLRELAALSGLVPRLSHFFLAAHAFFALPMRARAALLM